MKNSNIQWIGTIPDSWHLDRLQWHLDEIKESNNPVKTQQVLSLTNKLGVIPYEEKGEQGNKSKENVDEYKLAYPDTIVANSMNILIGSVGKCNYFGCVSPVYYVFKPKNGENIDFLNYIFQLTQFQKELRKYANGILEIRLRVSSNDILKRQIAFPSEKEQQRIVTFLDEKTAKIDQLIEIENKQIEKLKEYKQAVITEAVTKGLDKSAPMKDSGVEWIGEIPEAWAMNRLKFIATYNDDSLGEDTEENAEIAYVDIGSVSLEDGVTKIENFVFRDAPSRARRITRVGDIIISTVRTYLKAIATINQENLIVSTGFCVIRPSETMNKRYVEFFCKSNKFTGEVSRNSYGISYPAINASALINFWITIPPIETQKHVVEFLNEKCCKIDSLLKIKQKKIDMLNEYKKSLIYEYVTGKKEVV